MINKEIVRQLFIEEIKDQNIAIPKNINNDRLENHFIEFLEIDFYDWFKSNFNNYISDQVSSDWENIGATNKT